jgi:hypothetical protein
LKPFRVADLAGIRLASEIRRTVFAVENTMLPPAFLGDGAGGWVSFDARWRTLAMKPAIQSPAFPDRHARMKVAEDLHFVPFYCSLVPFHQRRSNGLTGVSNTMPGLQLKETKMVNEPPQSVNSEC